jgi:SAM-dependent methyltransferase
MRQYYDRLSAERLRRCYELAPPPVQAYLRAEVDYILAATAPGARVLELGCGYGRVLEALAPRCARLVGIDLSLASLALARRRLAEPSVALAEMNAAVPGFRVGSFDLVCCPQNGISAFRVDQRALIASTLELLAPGGRSLFFSYAEAFWQHRLDWFRIQAAHGLVGTIDEAATGNGTIVCTDGFRATTVSPAGFLELTHGLNAEVAVSTIEGASVVCAIRSAL